MECRSSNSSNSSGGGSSSGGSGNGSSSGGGGGGSGGGSGGSSNSVMIRKGAAHRQTHGRASRRVTISNTTHSSHAARISLALSSVPAAAALRTLTCTCNKVAEK